MSRTCFLKFGSLQSVAIILYQKMWKKYFHSCQFVLNNPSAFYFTCHRFSPFSFLVSCSFSVIQLFVISSTLKNPGELNVRVLLSQEIHTQWEWEGSLLFDVSSFFWGSLTGSICNYFFLLNARVLTQAWPAFDTTEKCECFCLTFSSPCVCMYFL